MGWQRSHASILGLAPQASCCHLLRRFRRTTYLRRLLRRPCRTTSNQSDFRVLNNLRVKESTVLSSVKEKVPTFSRKSKEARDFWIKKLQGKTGATNLKSDFERPSSYSSERETVDVAMPGRVGCQAGSLDGQLSIPQLHGDAGRIEDLSSQVHRQRLHRSRKPDTPER